MVQKDTSITIPIQRSHHFVQDINVHRKKILLQQGIGLVKIYGLVERKQKDLVQRRRQGDNMSCGCNNGGNMYGKNKKTKVKKAYSGTKVRKGGMKKPSVKFRGYNYKAY